MVWEIRALTEDILQAKAREIMGSRLDEVIIQGQGFECLGEISIFVCYSTHDA